MSLPRRRKPFRHMLVAKADSVAKRRIALVVFSIDLGSVCQEQFRHFLVSSFRCQVHWKEQQLSLKL